MGKMIKFFSFVMILVLFSSSSASASQIDLKSLSDEALFQLGVDFSKEWMARNKIVSIPMGTYRVGMNLPAGEYEVRWNGSGHFKMTNITVYKDDEIDFMNVETAHSLTESSPKIGRLVLKSGNTLSIEHGGADFLLSSALVFEFSKESNQSNSMDDIVNRLADMKINIDEDMVKEINKGIESVRKGK